MGTEILGLHWLEHPNVFTQAISSLRTKDAFTDATLACEGKFYPVHKFVLSTCSEYFSAIFEWTPCLNPVVVINNIPSSNLEALLDFMYKGEANVHECHIQDVMKAAECLYIKGLSLVQDDSNISKSRPLSPASEPNSKKRKPNLSVKNKDVPFVKPQMQGDSIYYHQAPSPSPTLSTSSYTARPTPTPPPNQSPNTVPSPRPTTPIHSPSPLTFSVSPSSTSQNQFQLSSKQIGLSQLNIQSPQKSTDNVPKMGCNLSPMDSTYRTISQPRSSFISNVKEEQADMMFPTLRSFVSTEDSSNNLPMQLSSHTIQYGKFSNSDLNQRGIHNQDSNIEVMDTKIMNIGEELHLDGPVKDLEIATEDGTVSIPEILEGFVDMRQLYGTKVPQSEHLHTQRDSFGSSKAIDGIAQCSSNSGNSVDLMHFKEESSTSESMYEFSEDLPETSGIGRMKKLKERNLKTYSRKNNNEPPVENFSDISYSSEVESVPNSFSPHALGTPLTSMVSSPMSIITRASTEGMSTPSIGKVQPSMGVGSSPVATSPSVQATVSSQVSTSGQATTSVMSSATGETSLNKEKKDATPKSLSCTTCTKTYKTEKLLARHMLIHTEFPYPCTLCELTFKSYKELITHRKDHADKKCDKCDFVTLRNDALKRHMQSQHDNKTFKCDHCPFSTNRSHILQTHVNQNHSKK